MPEFLALALTAPANQVTRAHRGETEFIDVDDPGVVADIDDPAAYERLLAGSHA
jgi:CTP:molybdopterin cytidylyltransferase MocA